MVEPEWLSIKHSAENRAALAKAKADKSSPSSRVSHKRMDLVLTLLEWTGRTKPLGIVIDELQYLTCKDWQMTRRLCALVHARLLRNVMVFLGATPIDNKRYKPLFKSPAMITKFVQLRRDYSHRVVVPSPWSLSMTRFFIKKLLDVGEVSPRVVRSVHSQCGGRPGFCAKFLHDLTVGAAPMIHVFDKKYLRGGRDGRHATSGHSRLLHNIRGAQPKTVS